MNRLVLIDGNAVLHRAYHAIPPLTAPDGSIVNAVYGFTAMLIRLFHDLTPTHIAVAFDRPKPTFRKKLYKEYQATRPKMDEALVGQIEKVHDMVRAFGIPIFEKDGFEADDVIGTIAKQSNDQVIIVTGDRDILQLVVDDKVMVYMPTKGLSEAKLYREADVKERMGVVPKLIPDLKGLMGDASDNYPGVPGIGPKTAIKLLSQYKTLEEVLKSDEFTKDQKESAKLSFDLATIRTDVKLENALPQAAITTLDTPEAEKILGDLHFHSLLKRLRGEVEKSKSKKEPKVKKEDPAGQQQQLF
jgi:DNA polymerase I